MRKKNFLFILCGGVTFFLGFEAGGYQAAVLSIAEEFQVSSSTMGSMIALQYAAIMVMPPLFGRLSDLWGKKKVLFITVPMFIAGCLITACSKSVALFSAGIFILGGGYSVCECVASAALVDAAPEKANQSLNLTQFLFSMGAVASPLIVNRLLSAGQSWRILFCICAGAYLCLFLLLLATAFPRAVAEAPTERGAFRRVLLRPSFLLLLLAIMIYVGLENGIVYYAQSLFSYQIQTPAMGSYAISAFWLFMAGSRLLFSAFRYSADSVVRICQLLLCAALCGLACLKLPIPALALFAAAGFFAGPIWPLIFSIGSNASIEDTGTATSLLSVGCGLGGALSPLILGALSESGAGLQGSYLLLAAAGFCGFLAMLIWMKVCTSGKRGE